jgi:hypothetical protein
MQPQYLLWAAAAVLLVLRQFVPGAVRPRVLLALPLVLGLVGVQAVAAAPPATAVALLLFSANVAAALTLGLLRGASMRVWRAADGVAMRQGTTLTLVLWAVSIAIRVGLGLLDRGQLPPDTIAFFLAATFGAQNLVLWLRTGGVQALAAPEARG